MWKSILEILAGFFKLLKTPGEKREDAIEEFKKDVRKSREDRIRRSALRAANKRSRLP